ncbi:hypothetical protein D3C83_86060 [compost metagenome]
MPFSCIVQRPAYSEEKETLPPETSRFLPNCLRNLSFAVIDTTFAPAAAKRARMVSPRSSSGPVITTASPVFTSR